jgi:hypothetical protein
MGRVDLFGVKKSQFKKANAVEVRKNKIHMKKLIKKYEEDIGDIDLGWEICSEFRGIPRLFRFRTF